MANALAPKLWVQLTPKFAQLEKLIKIKFADITHKGNIFPKTMKYYLKLKCI